MFASPIYLCGSKVPPFQLLNEEVARDIGKGLGTIVDIDNIAFNSDQTHFLCNRGNIPLSKPLRQGGPMLTPEGNKVWIAFKYERINGLCFTYGKLGHEMKACHQKSQTLGASSILMVTG
nr:hypothetical protein CFP56_50051 [Quercus suber]